MNQVERNAIDALDLKALRAKYSPQPVPPCRVCGGRLQMSYMGKGRTEWTCSTVSLEALATEAGIRHYSHSCEIIIDRSDFDVIHLLNGLQDARDRIRELEEALIAYVEWIDFKGDAIKEHELFLRADVLARAALTKAKEA